MSLDLIVLRDSPDWANFDLESSRPFLRRVGLPEDLIIEFVGLWDRSFKIDYRSIRTELKKLAQTTCHAVRGAQVVSHEDWNDSSSDANAWILFVDDDDWPAPHLFEAFGRPAAYDGARWANLRIGRIFAENGYAQGTIQRRPPDSVVYTNNYAVSGRTLLRLGRAAVFEHGNAQTVFDVPAFQVRASADYLSCAVKHPCCTISAKFLMQRPDFRADPHSEMARFIEVMQVSEPTPQDAWLAGPFARFRAFMTDALRPR